MTGRDELGAEGC